MELHESLYALGRSQGRELFNDADSFRGALDDYLDEDSATTGDINLLVDAVRLGAYQGMMSMLDSGADADRAVSEAGSRLARDRGSADVGGAMWALAVLGYATGKVSDPQVRRYRTQHASAPAPPPVGPATVLPPPVPGSAPAPPPGVSAPAPGVSSPAPTLPGVAELRSQPGRARLCSGTRPRGVVRRTAAGVLRQQRLRARGAAQEAQPVAVHPDRGVRAHPDRRRQYPRDHPALG